MMLSTMLLVGALATTAAGDTLYATTFGRNSNLVVVDYETGVTTVIGSTGYQVGRVDPPSTHPPTHPPPPPPHGSPDRGVTGRSTGSLTTQ
jgi:hypothetical protein